MGFWVAALTFRGLEFRVFSFELRDWSGRFRASRFGPWKVRYTIHSVVVRVQGFRVWGLGMELQWYFAH